MCRASRKTAATCTSENVSTGRSRTSYALADDLARSCVSSTDTSPRGPDVCCDDARVASHPRRDGAVAPPPVASRASRRARVVRLGRAVPLDALEASAGASFPRRAHRRGRRAGGHDALQPSVHRARVLHGRVAGRQGRAERGRAGDVPDALGEDAQVPTERVAHALPAGQRVPGGGGGGAR